MESFWTVENIKFIGSDSPHIYSVKVTDGVTIAMNKALLTNTLSTSALLNTFNIIVDKDEEDCYIVTFKRKIL